MGDNPTMVDQIFAVGVLAFSFALIIFIKDLIDGSGFSSKERENAVKAFGLAGILVLASLTMAMITTDYVEVEPEDNFINNLYYYGGASAVDTSTVIQSGSQFALGASSASDRTSYQIPLNTTTFDKDDVEKWRGFNMEFNDDGITRIKLFHSANSVTTDLIDSSSDTDIFNITSSNGKTTIKANWSDVETLSWIASATFSGTYSLNFVVYIDSNYAESSSKTLEMTLTQENQKELSNYLVWIVMALALYVPMLVYLDAENELRKAGRRVRKTLGL